MKSLAVLALAAWLCLGPVQLLHADTALRPPAVSTAAVAIPAPPPPVLVEAVDGELDLRTLGNRDATVEVTYPEIANGNTVGLYWTSNNQQYRAPVQTVSGGATKVVFKIPNTTVIMDLGQSPVLSASIGIANEKLVISQPLAVKVTRSEAPDELPAPTLPGSPDNQVDIGALTGDLIVSVSYPGLAAGQSVKAVWTGATTYTAPVQVAAGPEPIEFSIPEATVIASLGRPVTLHYEVTDGGDVRTSAPATLAVNLVTLHTAPAAPEALDGKLDLKTLKDQPARITFTYPGIAAGQVVGLRWTGSPDYDTPHPAIGATPRPLEFAIPYDRVENEKGKTVEVTASVSINNRPLVISPKLILQVVDTRPDGAVVAVNLNARFNDVRAVCDNNTPAYYCSGVIIRSTENGNYDPWNPSPAAIRLGGVSFSYMRKDANVTSLYHASGFTFLPQQVALAQGKAVDYLCIYAYDAGTLVGVRGAQGCGLKPRAARYADASTCSSVGVQTVAQWYAYTKTIANRDYQCSLSTADPSQFLASLQVRANKPANIEALWNEMMAKLWPQDTAAQLPLESFFYTTTTGLTEAKTYQTKYKTRTASWLPILKLDLTKLDGNPFSYSEADQAVQP